MFHKMPIFAWDYAYYANDDTYYISWDHHLNRICILVTHLSLSNIIAASKYSTREHVSCTLLEMWQNTGSKGSVESQ